MWSFQNLLFTICVALRCLINAVGVIHVTGYLESEVNVSCSYGQGYESYEKYLCKNNCGDSDVLITTSKPVINKYRIHDDKTARIFTTTISDLHSEDAGKYWCGVTRTGKDIYTEVKLKLVKDSCCDTVTKVQSYEGYSEFVSCPYESQYQNSLKYICRGNRPSTCLQQALITSDTKQNGRFRLDDEKMSGKFTVNISSLTKNDSGSYLCGVQRNSDLYVFSAVELEVKEWCCVKSTKINGTVGHPLTLQCPYPLQHRDNRKFLCKGEQLNSCKDITSQSRFKLEGNGSSSSFSVVITKLEEADAGTYWCGSDSERRPGNYTKIQLSIVFLQHTSTVPSTVEMPGKTSTQITDAGHYVGYTVPPLLLLLICVFAVIVYKCKHQKAKEDETVMNRNTQNEGALEEVMPVAENKIYESQDVVIYSNKETSELQSAGNDCEDLGEDEPDLENVTTEEIYCNGNFHNAKT
ncbi:polymeric immunoglobulin receptor-like [Simochromis diagramma]|uniref:polymeric immunoglobulin receptor-like n=1 Tax=Simochromis diagramma TaxID=43689 RepID=UPI001A7E9023|nr:polymeric immunoglobulin receptor-like [Simochromis diagramma]